MNDFTVIHEEDSESMHQCSDAWQSIFALLIKHNPDFINVRKSGLDCALDEIRRLQALDKRKK